MVVTVSVVLAPLGVGVRVGDAKVAVVPEVGTPDCARVTGEENPPTDVSVTLYLSLSPLTIVVVAGEIVIIKSGCAPIDFEVGLDAVDPEPQPESKRTPTMATQTAKKRIENGSRWVMSWLIIAS